MWDNLKYLFTKCWEIWDIDITFGNITIDLKDIAFASVAIWILAMLIWNCGLAEKLGD